MFFFKKKKNIEKKKMNRSRGRRGVPEIPMSYPKMRPPVAATMQARSTNMVSLPG